MQIVMGTESTLSDFNGGCDFALVELTPDYARLILSRMKALLELARIDPSFHEGHFWDTHASYLSSPDDDELDEMLDSARDTYVVLEDRVTFPRNLFQSVECSHMAVHVMNGEAEVSWRTALKNLSVYIESNLLPQSLIEEAVVGARPVTK